MAEQPQPPENGDRYYAGAFFNQAWDLLDKPSRTDAENDLLLSLSLGSLAHWNAREDCTPRHRSIGCWQVARVGAVIGLTELAVRFGQRALEYGQQADNDPFLVGYAHEALARASMVAGNSASLASHLAAARNALASIQKEGDAKALAADLETLIVK